LSSTLPLLEVAPLAFGAALVLTPLMGRLAIATGYLDHPEPRKPHPAPTALLGGPAVGLSIAIGALLAFALFGTAVEIPRMGVLVGGALSLALGLVDDRHPMRPAGKLLGQVAAAFCLVLWGARDGFLVENPLLGAAAMFGVVALLNAINFLDAMDGIVGAVIPITASGFVALSLLHGADIDLALAWGMIGAGAGFLVYNAPPARIFLGDAGSHLLGFLLAALTLQALDDALTWPHLAAVGCILSYPLFDVVFVICDRLLSKRPITMGSTDHTTHRLGRICGRWGTLGTISGLVTLGTVLGVLLWDRKNDAAVTAIVSIWGLGYAIFGALLRRASPTPAFDT